MVLGASETHSIQCRVLYLKLDLTIFKTVSIPVYVSPPTKSPYFRVF